MKRIATVMLCIVILTSICLAQERLVCENKPMVGGYAKVTVSEKVVTETLSFLKKSFPAFGIESVEEAYTQVVAGMNIKLVCKVSHPQCTETWELVVYRDLNGEYHLTGAKSVKK